MKNRRKNPISFKVKMFSRDPFLGLVQQIEINQGVLDLENKS